MKRSQQAVPKAETGAIRGDGRGTQGMGLPQGARNTSAGEHARGGALAKVKGAPTGDSGMRLPVQHPTANIANSRVGQQNPNTAAVATAKPTKRKTPSPFYSDGY